MRTSPHALSHEDIARYERDGFLIVRGLYDAGTVTDWKDRVVDFIRKEGSLEEASGVRVWMVDELDPYLRQRMADPHVVSILRSLVGPDIEFLSVKAVFKSASTDFPSPWHQDRAYWEGSPKISIWIALDRAGPANGCLKMIPGSHRKKMETIRVEDGHGFGWRIAQEALDALPVETLDVEAGDAVFFHDLAVHASHPNTAKTDRWSIISTYRDASVPDTSTTWKTTMRIAGA